MFLNYSTPIVRYTPPTCILEIYNKNLLNLSLNSDHSIGNIYFQLHFDDPRLPQEEKEKITGDRKLLVKLREEINNYINEFIDTKIIKVENKKDQDQDQILDSNSNKKENNIKLIPQGLCQHKLYYLGETKQIINISNTQLFDIANALENYHQESAEIAKKHNRNFWQKLSLTLGIIGIFSLIGGLWWWRNEQQIAQQANESQQQALEEEDSNLANLDQVIPPSPIDSSEVPELLSPQETEEMKNRETLPPPPPTLTQPPVDEKQNQNIDDTALLNNSPQSTTNTRVTPVNITPQEILPPPPSPPLPPPPPVTLTESENNVIAINSNPQPLPPPSLPPSPTISNIQPIPPSTSKNQKPPRLNTLPVLESSNNNSSSSNGNTSGENPTEINSVAINATPNLNPPPQTTISKSATSTNHVVTQDVKQYFQGKWQPPENLQQSIEYRLLINENGSLSRITPLGQSAQVFLDVTGMPLLGQTLSASAQESVTVRLILSPNGDVRTFQE